ncbi:hypothetical protein ABZ714_14355 [Streptomyces sp. NPDC006798]|uniref:hypothetical protein n=1 Tax=unclassified Streptomyces TaxID=2593676 RepID=UPI0033E90671
MTYADYTDVVNRWTDSSDLPATQPQVETLLSDAEAILLREFPNLVADVTAGTIPESLVVMVEVNMVTRRLRNPAGVRSIQEGAGPYQQTITHGGDDPGSLYLTDEERRLLSSNTYKNKAFSIDTTPSFWRSPSESCEVWWTV